MGHRDQKLKKKELLPQRRLLLDRLQRIKDVATMSKMFGIRTTGTVAKHNPMQDKFPLLSRRRSQPVKKVSMVKLVIRLSPMSIWWNGILKQ